MGGQREVPLLMLSVCAVIVAVAAQSWAESNRERALCLVFGMIALVGVLVQLTVPTPHAGAPTHTLPGLFTRLRGYRTDRPADGLGEDDLIQLDPMLESALSMSHLAPTVRDRLRNAIRRGEWVVDADELHALHTAEGKSVTQLADALVALGVGQAPACRIVRAVLSHGTSTSGSSDRVLGYPGAARYQRGTPQGGGEEGRGAVWRAAARPDGATAPALTANAPATTLRASSIHGPYLVDNKADEGDALVGRGLGEALEPEVYGKYLEFVKSARGQALARTPGGTHDGAKRNLIDEFGLGDRAASHKVVQAEKLFKADRAAHGSPLARATPQSSRAHQVGLKGVKVYDDMYQPSRGVARPGPYDADTDIMEEIEIEGEIEVADGYDYDGVGHASAALKGGVGWTEQTTQAGSLSRARALLSAPAPSATPSPQPQEEGPRLPVRSATPGGRRPITLELGGAPRAVMPDLPCTNGLFTVLQPMELRGSDDARASWYMVRGGRHSNSGNRFFAVIWGRRSDVDQFGHGSASCVISEHESLSNATFAANKVLPDAARRRIGDLDPSSPFATLPTPRPAGARRVHADPLRDVADGGGGSPLIHDRTARFGMPRGAQEPATIDDLSAQVTGLAASLRGSPEDVRKKLELDERMTKTAERNAATARAALLLKTKGGDKTRCGFTVQAKTTLLHYMLRDLGRGDAPSLFCPTFYGLEFYDHLIALAARKYGTQSATLDLRVRITNELAAALCLVRPTDSQGSWGFGPTMMFYMSDDEYEEAHTQAPSKDTKVDVLQKTAHSISKWGCGIWVERMGLMADVFCRAYSERHRAGFTDALSYLHEKHTRDKALYNVTLLHSFFFDFLNEYLTDLEMEIESFSLHIAEEGLTLDGVPKSDFVDFYKDKHGEVEEVAPFTFSAEGRAALDDYMQKIKDRQIKKLMAAAAGNLGKPEARPKSRASGMADGEASGEDGYEGYDSDGGGDGNAGSSQRGVRFGLGGDGTAPTHEERAAKEERFKKLKQLVDIRPEERARVPALVPMGTKNGKPTQYCFNCMLKNSLCQGKNKRLLHLEPGDKAPKIGHKIDPILKLVALCGDGMDEPNTYTPDLRTDDAVLKAAANLRKEIAKKDEAKARFGGDAGGDGMPAPLSEVLDGEPPGGPSVWPVPYDSSVDRHKEEDELFGLLDAFNLGKIDDKWIRSLSNACNLEEFSAVDMTDASLKPRLLIMKSIDEFVMARKLFDPITTDHASAFVKGHLLHAALEAVDGHSDLNDGVASLVANAVKFRAAMAVGLDRVGKFGKAHSLPDLRRELQRLGLLTSAADGLRASGPSTRGVAFSKSANVYDAGTNKTGYTAEIGGLVIDGYDLSDKLVTTNGELRRKACVLLSAAHGIAATKGVEPNPAALLDALQRRATELRDELGLVSDREWHTRTEIDAFEYIHDLLNDNHDFAMMMFAHVVATTDDPACQLHDVDLVGLYAKGGRITDVRSVMGEEVAALGPRSHLVVQLYSDNHATLLRLDTARDASGAPVDLTTPGAFEAWVASVGMEVDRQVAVGSPALIQASADLDEQVEVRSLPPCQACLSASKARDVFRASGCYMGGNLFLARQAAKAGTAHACAVLMVETKTTTKVNTDGVSGDVDADEAEEEGEPPGGENMQSDDRDELAVLADLANKEFKRKAVAMGVEVPPLSPPAPYPVSQARGARHGENEGEDVGENEAGGENDIDVAPSDTERQAALTAIYAAVSSPEDYDPKWRELVTLAFGALLFECGALERMIKVYRHEWHLLLGQAIDPKRVKYLRGRISNHLVDNLLYISQHGVSAQYRAKRRHRLIRPTKGLVEDIGGYWAKTWTQVRKGQVLLFDQSHLRLLGDIASSPMMAVPKRDSYGSLTGANRYVHNLSSSAGGFNINEGSHKRLHPTVTLPTHKEFARGILAQSVKYPGLPKVAIKLDVADAFPCLEMAPNDCALFVTNLNEERAEMPEVDHKYEPLNELSKTFKAAAGAAITCLVVYITGTFGFSGLPGSYQFAGSSPISEFHQTFRAALPSWHSLDGFASLTLVDDGAIALVDLGVRANLCKTAYMVGMFLVFGAGAMNMKKLAEDGTWSGICPVWGLVYDLRSPLHDLFFTVSEVRVERVRRLLSDKMWDHGSRHIRMKSMQSMVGMLRHVGQVYRPAHTAYAALHMMLRTVEARQQWVGPPGTEAEVERHWLHLWDSVEFLRVQLSDPNLWRANMLCAFTSVISVPERLAIPGELDNVVPIGSDSTPWLLAVFNYRAKECGVIVWTEEVVRAISDALVATGVPEEMLDELIISIKELASTIVIHAIWGKRETGRLFVNMNDNYNSCRWMWKRVAHNPFAQHILLVIGRLEWSYGNDTHLIYVNTKRNVISDYSTRWVNSSSEAKALIDRFDHWLAKAMPGYIRLDVAPQVLTYLVTPWSRRTLALVNELNPLPRQLAEKAGRVAEATDDQKLQELLAQQLGGVDVTAAHRSGALVCVGNGSSLLAWAVHRAHPRLDALVAQGTSSELGRYLAVARNEYLELDLEWSNLPWAVARGSAMVLTTGNVSTYDEVLASRLHGAPLLVWIHVCDAQAAPTPSVDPGALGFTTRVLTLKAEDYGEASTRSFQVVIHERVEVEHQCGPAAELQDRKPAPISARGRLAPLHLLDPTSKLWYHVSAKLSTQDEVALTFREQSTVGTAEPADLETHLGLVVEAGITTPVYTFGRLIEGYGERAKAYYFDDRPEVVAAHENHAIKTHLGLGVLRRLTKYDLWMCSGHPLIELLELEKMHEEDETSHVPEPSEQRVAEHLRQEPPLGVAMALARVYGQRTEDYLKRTPCYPRPKPRLVELDATAPTPIGFVPPDFDAHELMSGAGWRQPTEQEKCGAYRVSGEPVGSTLRPDAPEYVLPSSSEDCHGSAMTAQPDPVVPTMGKEFSSDCTGDGPPRGVHQGAVGTGTDLGAREPPRRGLARRGGRVSLFTLLTLLTVGVAVEPTPTRTSIEPATRGINVFDSVPGFLEDIPRGDRRGTLNHARDLHKLHVQGLPKSKALPRRRYRAIRGAQWSSETHGEIEDELRRLEVSALSKSTIKAYDTAFRHWSDFLYNEYGEEQPYLTGEDRREDERRVVMFIAWQSSLGRVYGTIKKKLCGIKYHHRAQGLPDPIGDSWVVSRALKGVKNKSGAARGKMPATKDLLEHISSALRTGSLMLACVDVAIQLAFFALLRSSEYCVNPLDRSGAFDRESTLLDGDIMLVCRGALLPWDAVPVADHGLVTEVVISIKKSKTDQGRQGVTRGVDRCPNAAVCPVEATLRFVALRLARGVDFDESMPFMRWGTEHTQHLRRAAISSQLKSGAEAMGQPTSDYATHSLRIGGATALLHAGATPDQVRRFGRWKSDCWQQYTWNTRGMLAGLSALIARSSYTLEQSTADFLAHRRAAGRPVNQTATTRAPAASPSADDVMIEHDLPVQEYLHLIGSEWYDPDDDEHFIVLGFSEDSLVEELDSKTGDVRALGTYVLCTYRRLGASPADTPLWSTAREVARWVRESARPVPLVPAAPAARAPNRRRSASGATATWQRRRVVRRPAAFVPGTRV